MRYGSAEPVVLNFESFITLHLILQFCNKFSIRLNLSLKLLPDPPDGRIANGKFNP